MKKNSYLIALLLALLCYNFYNNQNEINLSFLENRYRFSLYAAIFANEQTRNIVQAIINKQEKQLKGFDTYYSINDLENLSEMTKNEIKIEVFNYISNLSNQKKNLYIKSIISWCKVYNFLFKVIRDYISPEEFHEALCAQKETSVIYKQVALNRNILELDPAIIGGTLSSSEMNQKEWEAILIIAKMNQKNQLTYYKDILNYIIKKLDVSNDVNQ